MQPLKNISKHTLLERRKGTTENKIH
uniref:Uncharacterized protein n=1 Tax=Rhizophora mucronata TaxID=61149 RepID=A0A2P2NVT2_RHIMU